MIITVRVMPEGFSLPGVHRIIQNIEVTDDKCGSLLAEQLGNEKIDVLINNAGYFFRDKETLDNLNMSEELKMIDICALGPLRITAALKQANLLKTISGGSAAGECSKVINITSQGGAIEWRFTQNPEGGDYGHHMSKAAANMMSVLLSQELKGEGVSVGILHPGFNRTGMIIGYVVSVPLVHNCLCRLHRVYYRYD